MSKELSKSNQQLLTAILILLSAPVLYSLWNMFFIEGKFTVSKINIYSIWNFLRPGISIFLIVLVALRKFGILLFLIADSGIQVVQLLFRLPHFNDLTFEFWAFQLVNLAALIVMILLLQQENNRFFNLNFNTEVIGFKKTSRLMVAFILVSLLTQTIELVLTFFLSFNLQLTNFLNPYTVLFLLILVLTIIGMVKKTKIMNLAFFLVSASVLDSLFYSGNLILVPFTENWNSDSMFYIVYASVLDLLFITFGILGYLIIRSYFREKTGPKDQWEAGVLDAF